MQEERTRTLEQLSLGASVNPASSALELRVGQTIGPFRLLEVLGRGGMGQVFLAEQLEPVQRRIALKFMRHRLPSGPALARFLIERQALARMQHPNIAQIHEAGTTADGFPYLAMEYVDGTSLMRYCRLRRLGLRARLELFQRVCLGVAHAHQKGVVHRDLKPSNVLVTEVDGVAQPKLIDFGIATATLSPGASGIRPAGALLGTPGYMSPEQAGGATDVDTRSDVYALGAMLFELLTDTPAYDRGLFGGVTDPAALRELLLKHTPESPSARLAVPSRGGALPPLCQAARPIRHELDAVVAHAMHPDRNQRLPGCMELHAEIGRFLSEQPLASMPATALYRTRKFVRRHRLALALGALILVLLLTALLLVSLSLLEAQRQRDLARAREAELSLLADFQGQMLTALDPAKLGAQLRADLLAGHAGSGAAPDPAFAAALDRAGPTDAARRLLSQQLLAPALALIRSRFAERPLLAAALEDSLVAVQLALGDPTAAQAGNQRALEHRLRALGPLHVDTLKSRARAVELALGSGHADTRLAPAEELIADCDRSLGRDAPLCLRSRSLLAGVLGELGNRAADALALAEQVEAAQSRQSASHAADHLDTLARVAALQARNAQFETAAATWERLVRLRRSSDGPQALPTLAARQSAAAALTAIGRADEAVAALRELLAERRQLHGLAHPLTAATMTTLATALTRAGEHESALAMSEEGTQLTTQLLGPAHPDSLRAQQNLAAHLTRRGDREWLDSGDLESARKAGFDRAQALYEQVIRQRTQILGAQHPDTLNTLANLGDLLHRSGRYAEALRAYEQVAAGRAQVLPTAHPGIPEGQMFLGRALGRVGQCERAIPLLRDALQQILDRALGEEPVQISAWALAQCLDASGDRQGADAILETHLQRLLNPEPPGPGQRGTHIHRELQPWLVQTGRRKR